ncbi:phosphatidylglycerophosphatase A family protein [Candidatus Sneabacter namystus]|uniref:Phosphatidylglycerophosphatase A n=1 Tax=Candidatus Sneabacter namystus TaxID=2601646 RepID=A0A5C0UJF1_9RICK|nr:phosphatidylglycerophosphatase A [Candidatus Sneabacter namystus]QEK39731.1 phosphatidylglycerophosphatase A [Candidatus Sneabacter namystus]
MIADKRVLVKIATLGPIGFLPAPGTLGSAISCIAHYLIFSHVLHHLSLSQRLKYEFLALIIGIVISIVSINKYIKSTQKHDPKEIIIDEVVGQWCVFVCFDVLQPFLHTHTKYTLCFYITCFVLFRIFDIFKIPPVSTIDNKYVGTVGILLDDIAAGIMASALTIAIHLVWKLLTY